MGLGRVTKKVFGLFFNFKVSQWLDYEGLKKNSNFFIDNFKLLFNKPQTLEDCESFEEALERLGIAEHELALETKRNQFLAYLFVIIFVCLISYTIFLAYNDNIMGMIMSFFISIYSLLLSFRYHLWYYQLHNRRLYCNLSDWCRSFGKMAAREIVIAESNSAEISVTKTKDEASSDSEINNTKIEGSGMGQNI